MQKTSALVRLAQTGLFLAVLMGVQALALPNLITGVVVNAVFVYTVLNLQRRYAVILGCLTPFGAIVSGHMPPFLYPMLPVIMLGNLILIWVYGLLLRAGLGIRLLAPSFGKAVFIWVIGKCVISYFELNEKMKWAALSIIAIQFFTSAAGVWLGESISGRLKAASKKTV